MKNRLGVAAGLAVFSLCLPVVQAQALPFHYGSGVGYLFPEQILSAKALGVIAPSPRFNFRTNLEITSLFGSYVVPIEEMVIFKVGTGFRPYLGAGAGALFVISRFGTAPEITFSGVGGIEADFTYTLFIQIKVRALGTTAERVTYQLDMGVIF